MMLASKEFTVMFSCATAFVKAAFVVKLTNLEKALESLVLQTACTFHSYFVDDANPFNT